MKLIDAIRADDADAVRKALGRTRDINKGLDGGYRPLDIAAQEGKVNAIPVLLEAGADAHDPHQPVFSALGRAADGKRLEAVRLLLTLVRFSPEEISEAATAAARQRQIPILEVLRAAGADLDGAMEWAVRDGHTDVVRWCLAAGVDPNLQLKDVREGATQSLLHAAVYGASATVVAPLVEAGADVNLPEPKSHGDGVPWNALFVAKMGRKPGVVEYLLSVGAKMPQVDPLPFEPGVEFPDTFTEALVRAPTAPAAAALAKLVGGEAHPDAWGKSFVAGQHGYTLIRLEGSAWTSVLPVTGASRVVDQQWKDLCLRLSHACAAPVVLLCHEDTSGSSGYSIYDRGELVEDFTQGDESLYEEVAGLAEEMGESAPPETLGTGLFFSKRGRTLTAEQMQNGYNVLRDLAVSEGFRTLNYGPGAPQGEPFDLDLLGNRRPIADAAYVTA